MKLILPTLLLAVLAVAGCQNAAQFSAQGTSAGHAIGADLSLIQTHASAALPLVTSPAAMSHLKAIQAAATDGQQQVPKVQKAIDDLQKAYDGKVAELAAERNHWLGYKSRIALTTIAIVVGAWLLTMAVLWFFIPACGPLFANAFRVGLAGLSKFGKWVEDSIESRLEKFNAKVRARLALNATPVQANVTGK